MRSDMEGEGGGSKRKDGKDGSKCQLQRPVSSGMESERRLSTRREKERQRMAVEDGLCVLPCQILL